MNDDLIRIIANNGAWLLGGLILLFVVTRIPLILDKVAVLRRQEHDADKERLDQFASLIPTLTTSLQTAREFQADLIKAKRELEDDKRQLQDKYDALAEQVEAANKRIVELEKQLAARDARIEKLEQQLSAQKAQIEKLEAENTRMEQQLSAVQEDRDKWKAKADERLRALEKAQRNGDKGAD